MMGVPPAKAITLHEFQDILQKYPDYINAVAKPPKNGQPSLEELDRFRYIDAPSRLSINTGAKQFELSDIEKLVQWKIRHGKFRPFLPKLVASNTDEMAREATRSAFASYAAGADVKATLKTIEQLKGIGPATSSLILAVHDPDNILFFSDEAYHWFCAPDSDSPPDLKYTAKEYDDLRAKVKALIARLKVSPIDIEKVAYVLKHGDISISVKGPSVKSKNRPSASEVTKEGTAGAPSRHRSKPALRETFEDVAKNEAQGQPTKSRGRTRSSSKVDAKEDIKTEGKDASTSKLRGRPKPDSGVESLGVRDDVAAPSPSIIASKRYNRVSKRKAGDDEIKIEGPVRKRGRQKGKAA